MPVTYHHPPRCAVAGVEPARSWKQVSEAFNARHPQAPITAGGAWSLHESAAVKIRKALGDPENHLG